MSQIYKATASSPSVPTNFKADAGTAVPAGNTLKVYGSSGITTTGSGDTLTISRTNNIVSYTNVVGPDTYVVQITDQFLSCDTTLGPITIVLPIVANYSSFVIKDRTGTSGTNNITITTVAGLLPIDGDPFLTISDPYENVQVLNSITGYEVY